MFTSRKFFILCLLVAVCIAGLAGYSHAASLAVTLLTVPRQLETIVLDSQPEPSKLIARVSQEGVKFSWTLEGPGRIEEQNPNRKVVYIPPKSLEHASQQVTITVTATNDRGETATESITLTLQAQNPATDIQQLLQEADAFFQRTFYTEPEDKNAFALYRHVLEVDPANVHARENIARMAKDYHKWIGLAEQNKEQEKAEGYREKYEQIVSFLDSLDPVPTPSPSPTAMPLPTATPTVSVTVRIQEIIIRDANGNIVPVLNETCLLKPGELVNIDDVRVEGISADRVVISLQAIRGSIVNETVYIAPSQNGVRDPLLVKVLDTGSGKLVAQTAILMKTRGK